MKHAVFVAAENAALPGGKVGGVGDVVRDLPVALADAGWRVSVVVPGYGFLHATPGMELTAEVSVNFAGVTETARVFLKKQRNEKVEHFVIDHPLLAPQGPGKIYCDDGGDRPFATDAGKFAFFSAAAAAWLAMRVSAGTAPDVVHLHDWHAALLLLLRARDPACQSIKALPCVFTIHNLAMQGIRPLRGDPSALESWFPHLDYTPEEVGDPRYPDCVNPMATAIRLANRVNTVSPTYAREICIPDDPARGFHGGAGLHNETSDAARDERLVGILNGCFYPENTGSRSWNALLQLMVSVPAGIESPADLQARLRPFRRRRPVNILTSIGRFTTQKVELFLQPTPAGKTALEQILDGLKHDSIFIMLGSGDPHLEQRLADIMVRYPHALLLRGYNESLAQQIYNSGDLFLMPSSFEPCGISQMLAMRSGQPCVVHRVGGLADTVEHQQTGFVFGGSTQAQQAENFVTATARALALRGSDPKAWQGICKAAAAKRFSWGKAAQEYIHDLYLNAAPQHAAGTQDSAA